MKIKSARVMKKTFNVRHGLQVIKRAIVISAVETV